MLTTHFQRVLALFLFSGLASLLGGCHESQDGQESLKNTVISPQIDSARLSETVRVLASDEFYGRAPGGPGEALTVRSEERRVGKECASMCRSRWSPYH